MTIHFTDYPHFIPYEEYENAMMHIVNRLKEYDRVVTIYQVGGIAHPGISDIDLMVVFRDDSECHRNPLKNLSKSEKYLFKHKLYGVKKNYFSQMECYAFFENFHLLWGEQVYVNKCDLSSQDIQILKSQIALEYLIKMYITLTVAITYRIIRVREILLHSRALLKDLEFLNIENGNLYNLVQTAVNWRNNWFQNYPSQESLTKWVFCFCEELLDFLKETLRTKNFYVPKKNNFNLANNIKLLHSDKIEVVHKGMPFPSGLGWLGQKYFNLQHRFNEFEFKVPFSFHNIPKIILKRYKFIADIISYNHRFFKHFVPLAFGLSIFKD